jgi:two-component system copper resistance phosphate regulon response regulator CusR
MRLLLVEDEALLARREVHRNGRALHLTPKEFALLEYLMLHAGRVLDRMTLAEHVWDAGYDMRSNVIEVIVGRLRRKLEEGGEPQVLHTVKGVGYVLRAAAQEAG